MEDNDVSGNEVADSSSDDQSASSADSSSSSSSFAFTRLRNFDDLENFHTDILEADHPLDLIGLYGDCTWHVFISPFGRRWSVNRGRWVEEGEEEDESDVGGEGEEQQQEEARRTIGDTTTRHNKNELRRCFISLLEILAHFQYQVGAIHFYFDDENKMNFFAEDDYDDDGEKEHPQEEQTTKAAALRMVRVFFDCGSHRSTDTDLPFLKWLKLHQRMSKRIALPWQFFLDQGEISDNAIFQSKYLEMELNDQLTLTTLVKLLDKERFPNLKKIALALLDSSPGQRNFEGLLRHLGSNKFSLLSDLLIIQVREHTTLSLSAVAWLSKLQLRSLLLSGLAFASETAMRAFVDGVVETGTLSDSLFLSKCLLPENGVLYLLQKASKLLNLRSLCIDSETLAPVTNIEALRSAYRQCNKESTSLRWLPVLLNATCWVGPKGPISEIGKEAHHYWDLNRAGRRAIQDLPSISPPGLVAVLLEKAYRAYQENGIYHMLREHADLRTIVADSNGISKDKQRQSNKKQKV